MAENQRPKRLYLINRDFQLRYAWASIVVGVLSTITSCAVILYPLYIFEILRIPVFLPLPILGVMALAAIFNVGFIGFMSIFVTHRMAGPMYNLVRHIRRVEEGRWVGEMRLREHDEMKYVARNFNGMIHALSDAAKQDLNLVSSLQEYMESRVHSPDDKVNYANEVLTALNERYHKRLGMDVDDTHGDKE